MDTILSVEKLNVYYKNKESLSARFRKGAEKNVQHVLKDVSFAVKRGAI